MNNRYLKHKRIRAKISGTLQRPRISIFKSNKNIYLQAINDDKGETIAAAKNNPQELAKKLLAKKISEVIFDRSGYQFHGRIKKIADELRKAGLEF